MEGTHKATRTSSSLAAIAPTPYSSMPFYGHTVDLYIVLFQNFVTGLTKYQIKVIRY